MKNKNQIPNFSLEVPITELKEWINQDRFVPKWFYEWYRMVHRLQNKTCKEVDFLLENQDWFWAKELFEEITDYNKSKIWH